MKTIHYCILIILIFIIYTCTTHQKENHGLRGPYLGQRKPGQVPEMFAPGFISSGLSDAFCNFTADGKEVYFNVAYDIGKNPKAYIAFSKIVNGVWTVPEFMSFTKSEYLYAYPFLSYDGSSLYFVSNEPTNDSLLRDDYNIWGSKRNGNKWDAPEPLPFPINGRGITSGPSVSLSGTLYYTVINEKEQAIYSSRLINGEYTEPEKLPVEVNSTDNQFDGVISPDESYLILPVFNRQDSYGMTDLYITFRNSDGSWTPVKNMGSIINTKLTESAARISADGKFIFLTGLYTTNNWDNNTLDYSQVLDYYTKPGYGRSDIYWISSTIVDKLRAK